MAINYNYNGKDTMKALSSTTATTGINTPRYAAFENIPITIAASRALSTSMSLVSTSITNETISGFDSVSYYKNATANTSAGGVLLVRQSIIFQLTTPQFKVIQITDSQLYKQGILQYLAHPTILFHLTQLFKIILLW
jgi:hypothetical protein